MNIPKFLQNFQIKRSKKKMRKYMQSNEYKIKSLTDQIDRQDNLISDLNCQLKYLRSELTAKKLEALHEEEKRTDPFYADKWKVVYDPNGKVSTVYFNDQELYGVQRFDVDFDSVTEGQTPRFTLESYGSITIETESE